MTISIIIPVYNGATTIEKTLKSLFSQTRSFDRLIIINDGSRDESLEAIKRFFKTRSKKKLLLINHKTPIGLAANYNQGIKLSDSDLIVTLHQDVVLYKNSLQLLITPFLKNQPGIVASYHLVLHPIKVWKQYNFWQKAFFSRLVGRKFYGLDGKFDCFWRQALIKVGLFDQKHFRTAGEDGEMICRLKSIGSLVKTEARIIHLHQSDNNFAARDIIKKQAQYSEAQGVMLRRGVIRSPKQIFLAFFREFLLVSLLIPYLRFVGMILIIVYAFYYTRKMYTNQIRDPRIIILPLLNVFLLLVSFYFSLRGIILAKQSV